MSSQTIYFTDPSVITGIQTEVSTLESTQMNLVGRERNTWTGVEFFYGQSTGSFQNEVWKGNCANGQDGNRWLPGYNPESSQYSIRSFQKALASKLPWEQLQGYYNVVIDENYVYSVIALRNPVNYGDLPGISLQDYTFLQQAFDHNTLYAVGGGSLTMAIAKFEKFTLKTVKIVALYSLGSGKLRTSGQQIHLSDDAVYLPCASFESADATRSGLLKLDKDLNLIWEWFLTNTVSPDNYPYYDEGPIKQVQICPPNIASGRNYTMVIAGQSCLWQYTSIYGTNLFTDPVVTYNNTALGLVKPAFGDSAFLDFLKMTPGFRKQTGKTFGFRDYGSSYTLEWTFDSCPVKLQSGDLFPIESVIPGNNKTRIYYNLWNTGATGTKFQVGVPGTNYFDTAGATYTSSGAATGAHGHWLFYNYTGALVSGSPNDFNANTNPLGIGSAFEDNGVAFFNFLDGGANQAQLLPGNIFSRTGSYVGYKMTRKQNWLYPFTCLWSNPANMDLSVFSPALSGFSTMQYDLTQPVTVSGETLMNQPIVKSIYTGAVGNYALDYVDAYNLNYYGSSNYTPMVYDPVKDCIYAGFGNVHQQPLEDMLNVINSEYSGGVLAGLSPYLGTGVANCGLVWDTAALAELDVIAHNTYLSTGAITDAGYASTRQDAVNKINAFKARDDAAMATVKSPRANRAMFGSQVALRLKDGSIMWSHKGVSADAWEFNYIFFNVGQRFFFDSGLNNDHSQFILIDNPYNAITNPNGIRSTSGRMLVSVSKQQITFHDPDATPLNPGLPTSGHPTVTGAYNYGISTADNKFSQGPMIYKRPHANGGNWYMNFYPAVYSKSANKLAIAHNNTALYNATVLGPGSFSAAGNNLNFNPVLGTNQNSGANWITSKPWSKGLEVFNMTTLGKTGAMSATGTVPTYERYINVAQDLGSGNGSNGISGWGNVILTSHHYKGAHIAYDIRNGNELWRQYLGHLGGCAPIMVNDIMYEGHAHQNNNPIVVDPTLNEPNMYAGNNHMVAYTNRGM
jgi:hypothetical protein